MGIEHRICITDLINFLLLTLVTSTAFIYACSRRVPVLCLWALSPLKPEEQKNDFDLPAASENVVGE